MMTEIGMADVELTAAMDGPAITLGEIAAFRVGDVMRLPATVDSLLSLESEGETMFRCRLGQSQGRFTVQIDSRFDRYQDFIKDIASGSAAA